MSALRLIVGLGNPGKKYEDTRHNLGFRVVRKLAEKYGIVLKRSIIFNSYIGKGRSDGKTFTLLLPLAYMNNSGKAVLRVARKKSIEIDNVLIVCDDLDVNFGQVRLRTQGGDGGHNGLGSIIESFKTKYIARLKLGIGRPQNAYDAADFVLSEFNTQEKSKVEDIVTTAVDYCVCWLREGTMKTMNKFNKRKENEKV